jgi:hypothetical protein
VHSPVHANVLFVQGLALRDASALRGHARSTKTKRDAGDLLWVIAKLKEDLWMNHARAENGDPTRAMT